MQCADDAAAVDRPAAFGSPSIADARRATLSGSLSFASPEAQVQRTAELLGAGAIVAVIPPVAMALRGKLAERIDDVVERELGARGAPSPYLTEWSSMPDDVGARLSDQLFRARTVGATGIAIALGSLVGITRDGVLTVEDSAVIRALAAAARDVPLVVLLDDGDGRIGGYRAAVGLEELVGESEALESEPLEIESDAETESASKTESESHELVHTAVDAPVAEAVITSVLEQVMPPAQARARGLTAGVPVAGPGDYWRKWAMALGAARGPQPLGAFEKLFTESYVPLSTAIASGVDDPRALRAHDEFRDGFERTYGDAFATFGATGRRPRLVMDAFDVAMKHARMHNARSSQVLVVDAMRYDLGGLVRDRLAERAAGVASLTSESVLWSALPTTTFRQLETLARGMEALRAPMRDEASDSLRGRSAETVRRLRVGSRELYKLDLVPALLEADPGPMPSAAHAVEALAGIASSVADALLHHLGTLPPRTFLLVIGDHGFSIDRRGQITDGGASPEEVLVPCFGYLVADLH